GGVGRVAAELEHAQAGAGGERLARRHHPAGGDGRRAAEREPIAHQATATATSAAGPSMRVKRGTTERTLSRAQKAMSSARPLTCRLRALCDADSPSSALAKLRARRIAAAAESAGSPPSPSATRPAQ